MAFVHIKADQNWAKKRRAGGAGSIGHGKEGGEEEEEDDRRDHAAKSSNDLFSLGRDPLGRILERPTKLNRIVLVT